MIENVLQKIYEKQTLEAKESQMLFDTIMRGGVSAPVLSSILTVLYMRGESIEEIYGAAKGILAHTVKFPRPTYKFGDIVGTGGDKISTINISSVSAIIASACGAKICKHGNRKITSRSGSADVLSSLGVDVGASPEKSRTLLDTAGVCFLMAPQYHPSFKHASAVRQVLHIRTIFNILGPLINPSRPDYVVNGVYDPKFLPSVAMSHKYLGVKAATVVHGSGIDEVCLHGKTDIVELREDSTVEQVELSPSDFGLKTQSIEDTLGGDIAYNTKVSLSILEGRAKDAHQNIVAANVALLLRTAGIERDLKKGACMAIEAMQNGSAYRVLNAIKE